ncbi:MAG: hypothetical protein Tsb0020_47890 [Haliangiales bacterium]
MREAVQSFAVSPPMLLDPGTLIDDRFLIEKRIGAGGMGVVYLARDLRLSRPVALKLSVEPPTADVATRLEREAIAMAQLNHPHVVTVHESGRWQEHRFIAMAYMAGGTARQWRNAQPRSWREVIEFYQRVGSGLAAAHHAGLVHRDFKPENVMLDEDGRPCVGDFGLAYEVATRAATQPLSGEPVTQTGSIVGTPMYMAPEQFDGHAVDHRSDQFAFCVALFEALYGQRPFPGDTAAEIRRAIDHGPTRPQARAGPRRLYRILARGLASEPEERYRDMDALLADLHRAVRRPPALLTSAVITTGLITLAATGLLLSIRAEAPRDPASVQDIDAGPNIPPEPSCTFSLSAAGIVSGPDSPTHVVAASAIAPPVACYTFEPADIHSAPSGMTIEDRCGYHHGQGPTGLLVAEGAAGHSLEFSGAEHVAIPDLHEIREQFTIAVWVRMDSAPIHPPNPAFVDAWDHKNRKRSWLFGTYRQLIGANTSADGAFNEPMVLDPRPVQLSEWVFYAVTYDGLVLTLYRNGVAVADHQRSQPGPLFTFKGEVWLGRSRNISPLSGLVGGLDELAIWDICLTAAQIAALC